jgi:hypothetical protein
LEQVHRLQLVVRRKADAPAASTKAAAALCLLICRGTLAQDL